MLVGVLISIMISIVVGVSLIPTIVDSINTAKNTANAPAGLSGLLDVLAYVFVAVILLAKVRLGAIERNLYWKTSQIRRTLNQQWHGNAELNSRNELDKCVETRRFVPRAGNGIVRYSLKGEVNLKVGAVAWMLKCSDSPFIQQCMSKISLIRGTLNQRWQGNPELAEGFIPSGKCRDFIRDIQLCGAVG